MDVETIILKNTHIPIAISIAYNYNDKTWKHPISMQGGSRMKVGTDPEVVYPVPGVKRTYSPGRACAFVGHERNQHPRSAKDEARGAV